MENKGTRTEHTLQNLVWGAVSNLMVTIFPFFIRSFVIFYLGESYLGLSGLITSIVGIFNLADLGFSSIIVASLYKPVAKEDKEEISMILFFGKTVYKWIGIIIFAGGLLVTPLLPLLIKGGQVDGTNIYLVFLVYVLNAAATYWFGAYKQALLQANQRLDVISKIGAFFSGLMYSVQLVVIAFLRNYYLYIVILPAVTIIINIYRTAVINRLYPEYRWIRRRKVRTAYLHDFKKKVVAFSFSKLRIVTRDSFDNIIISACLGLYWVVRFQNYYYFLLAVVFVRKIFYNAVIPGFGNSVATRSREDNYELLERITFIYNWISSWFAICLVGLLQPAMLMWLGDSFLLGDSIVIALGVYFFFWGYTDIPALIREVTGLWWEGKEIAVVEIVLNIVLNIMLVNMMGLFGVILATILTMALVNIPGECKVLFAAYFRCSCVKYLTKLMKYGFVALLAGGMTYGICIRIPNNIIGFIIKIFICSFLPNVCFVVCYRRQKEFNYMCELIRFFLKNLLMGFRKIRSFLYNSNIGNSKKGG